jgi:thiol-disulfide isomerase/thioredoxin
MGDAWESRRSLTLDLSKVMAMEKKMFVFVMVFALALVGHIAAPAKDPLQVDLGKLSQISLAPPENDLATSYLGITAGKNFTVSQIAGDVIIVEIFSMYCPICQREAPKVNEMHQLVEKDPALKGKFKILGVGTGNTPFEVEVFRKKFDVTFPLVSDENYTLEKAFSDRLRTPTFVVVKKAGNKELKLIDLHVGNIEDVGKYLREVAETGKRK